MVTVYKRDNAIRYDIDLNGRIHEVYSDDILEPGQLLYIRVIGILVIYDVTSVVDNKVYGEYRITK